MSRYLYIVVLVVAGEMVFSLPIHTARFFRPTMLEVFGFTNTQLGDLFAVYGIAAMAGYFPGGALADRFTARLLLTLSLVATAAGGLYMATIPTATGMAWLYGFWGVTTIFLFWGALIRATREWGGNTSQGTAFGVLEGGRGLVAATVSLLLVGVLASFMPEDAATASDEQRREGFRMVVLGYSLVTLLAGALTWLFVPVADASHRMHHNPFPNMLRVMARPVIWAQALIVVCAYCALKASDNYTLYLVQVMGFDEVEGARIGTWGAYIRPVAAVTAGLIADRFDAARSVIAIFIVAALAYVVLGIAAPESSWHVVIYLNLGITLAMIFAIRGVYFALLEETHTPHKMTGAAVGLVSVVGFTPEIFFAPIAGRILDATPGIGGFHDLFLLLAAIMVSGIVAVLWLIALKRNILRREGVN